MTLDEVRMTLDEAWAAAEAALPEGWRLQGVTPGGPIGSWRAEAVGRTHLRRDPMGLYPDVATGGGPTPIAALLALAQALSEPVSREPRP